MGPPRASIVIPSYNHGRFLDACLESALSPDADLEVVVVDDGSTDDSRRRLAAYRGEPRLRIYEQENLGAPAALNRGLELARGEIVFVLNSDDLFERERVPRFLERFEADREVTILTSWLTVIDGDGGGLGVKKAWRNMPPWPPPGPGPGLAGSGDPALALLEANWAATTSNVAFRRELVSVYGLRFAPLRYTHDWEFLLAGCEHGLGVVEEPLVRYRVHPGNTLGEGRAAGKGTMRFEILWTVARHAHRVLERARAAGALAALNSAEWRRREWSSLPRFGCDGLLLQLLCLRGESAAAPPTFEALLDGRHPFRARAARTLAEAP